jgi:hypothetical protein
MGVRDQKALPDHHLSLIVSMVFLSNRRQKTNRKIYENQRCVVFTGGNQPHFYGFC